MNNRFLNHFSLVGQRFTPNVFRNYVLFLPFSSDFQACKTDSTLPPPTSRPFILLWTQVVQSFKQVSVQNSFTRLAKHVNGFPCKNDPFDGYGTFLVRWQFFFPTAVNPRNGARESAVVLSV
jgi:hypothetical protein